MTLTTSILATGILPFVFAWCRAMAGGIHDFGGGGCCCCCSTCGNSFPFIQTSLTRLCFQKLPVHPNTSHGTSWLWHTAVQMSLTVLNPCSAASLHAFCSMPYASRSLHGFFQGRVLFDSCVRFRVLLLDTEEDGFRLPSEKSARRPNAGVSDAGVRMSGAKCRCMNAQCTCVDG